MLRYLYFMCRFYNDSSAIMVKKSLLTLPSHYANHNTSVLATIFTNANSTVTVSVSLLSFLCLSLWVLCFRPRPTGSTSAHSELQASAHHLTAHAGCCLPADMFPCLLTIQFIQFLPWKMDREPSLLAYILTCVGVHTTFVIQTINIVQ